MNTTDEWIQQRSGIKTRHYAEAASAARPWRRGGPPGPRKAPARQAETRLHHRRDDLPRPLFPGHRRPDPGRAWAAGRSAPWTSEPMQRLHLRPVRRRPIHPDRDLQEDPARRLGSPVPQPGLLRRGPRHGRSVRRRRPPRSSASQRRTAMDAGSCRPISRADGRFARSYRWKRRTPAKSRRLDQETFDEQSSSIPRWTARASS